MTPGCRAVLYFVAAGLLAIGARSGAAEPARQDAPQAPFEPREAAATTPPAGGPVAEPSGYRVDNYNAPVPATLSGVRAVLSADAAKTLMDKGGAVFIDVYPRAPKPANLPPATVWREPPHRSIAGAVWLANVGFGGLSEPVAAYFSRHLAQLSGGDRAKALVFFCLRDCWMSWNAAKRAIEIGYGNVYWFSEGTDAWEEHGYPIAVIEPLP